jgi:hypothetical protein
LDKVVLLGWGIVLLSIGRLALGLNAFLDPAFLASNSELWGLDRTLNSNGAVMMGTATLIVLNRIGALSRGLKRRAMSATFVVFVAALLISDQRTATFATVAGMAVVLAAWPKRRRAVVLVAGSLVCVIASVAVYGTWIAVGGDIISLLPGSSSDWTLENETYAWRVTQWQDYLHFYENARLFDQIVGLPLGMIRTVAMSNDIEMLQVSPHSGYVALLMDSGIVGIALFVSMLVIGVTKGAILLRDKPGIVISRSNVGLATAILISCAVFSYTYVVEDEQGLLLAIALQIVATSPHSAGRLALSRERLLGRRTLSDDRMRAG